LLASGSSLAQLRSVFDVKADADADGLRWVSATPRERDVSLKSIRVGFAQGQLQQLVIDDHFGQRSTIRFDGFKLNVGVTPAQFVFKPPAGADVVKQ
jgi:outer membrane lipoprotein carrier protein